MGNPIERPAVGRLERAGGARGWLWRGGHQVETCSRLPERARQHLPREVGGLPESRLAPPLSQNTPIVLSLIDIISIAKQVKVWENHPGHGLRNVVRQVGERRFPEIANNSDLLRLIHRL